MRTRTILLLILVISIFGSLTSAYRKEERKRQREERRRLAAEDNDNSAGVFNSKETSAGFTDTKSSNSIGDDLKDSGNRRQKNQRRDKIPSVEKSEIKNKGEDKKEDKDVITTPEPVLLSEDLLLNGYADDWREAQCLDIPRNMSMCQNIGYTKMRLPNLLHHTSLSEVVHGSKSWIPLLRSSCHPDTELFLCSLFSPVCLILDQAIYPCRSLCEMVKSGCEGLMIKHGYKWPDMLSCDKLPSENDLCIMAQSNKNTSSGNSSSYNSSNSSTLSANSSNSSSSSSSSNSSSSSGSYNTSGAGLDDNVRRIEDSKANDDNFDDEDSEDNATCPECRKLEKFSELQEKYCAADFVVKMRASDVLQHGIELIITANKNIKFLKVPPAGVRLEGSKGRRNSKKAGRNFYLNNAAQCHCLGLSQNSKGEHYLLMGRLQRIVGPGAPTYRMLLSYVAEYQSPALKRALRGLIRNDRCAVAPSTTAMSAVPPLGRKTPAEDSTVAAGDKKAVKVELRRKKLEQRLQKIERKEKKLKGRRTSANNDVSDNDDRDLNRRTSDKQEMKNGRKRTIERKNRRKQKDKTDIDVMEADTHGSEQTNKNRDRQGSKQSGQRQQTEKRERRLMKERRGMNKKREESTDR